MVLFYVISLLMDSLICFLAAAEAARMALFWASEVNQEYVIVEVDYQVLVNCSFSASITSVEGTRRRIRLCRPSYDIGGICDDVFVGLSAPLLF